MKLALDKTIGVHAQALQLRGERASVLASNIANSDTPNFKARDVDFRAAMQQAASSTQRLSASQDGHMTPSTASQPGVLKYRVPLQASLDGNTVDSHTEHTKYAENAMEYQVSLKLLGSKFKSLSYAIKGQS